MNFKTNKSANNRIVFVDKYDRSIETNFVDVSYNQDNYVLAKRDNSPFYAVLDLDGRETDGNLNVVHRFENGLLLTYKPFTKEYRSSDNYTYNVNYNVYAVYNYDTKQSGVIGIIQSDNVLEQKTAPAVHKLKSFMGKVIYAFDNFIFSEIFGESLTITASHFNFAAMLSAGKTGGIFDMYASKKIWNVADLTLCTEFDNETGLDNLLINNRIFKEVEYTLYTLVSYAGQNEITKEAEHVSEQPVAKKSEKVVSHSVTQSQNVRKNKWQMLFGGVV
ncbi:hypothetical protein, partial [Flavobacterium sp.]|uniref:hypothetical protein n=1 Tax=Flavobacterium sp. TaxID=239 RepID=UPI002604D5CC